MTRMASKYPRFYKIYNELEQQNNAIYKKEKQRSAKKKNCLRSKAGLKEERKRITGRNRRSDKPNQEHERLSSEDCTKSAIEVYKEFLKTSRQQNLNTDSIRQQSHNGNMKPEKSQSRSHMVSGQSWQQTERK